MEIRGLWKATFQTPLGIGYGVVVLGDGKVRGGDSAMFYTGTYSVAGDDVTAQIISDRHSPGGTSVFGPSRVEINARGKLGAQSIELRGNSPQAPNMTATFKLTRLAD